MSSNNRSFVSAAGFIAVAGFLSRILGFVREQIMAAKFGLSGVTDAYFAAFTIPDVLYTLLVGGALCSALIPIFSEYLVKGQEEEAWKVASILINIVTVVISLATVLGIIFAPQLLPFVAHGLTGENRLLAIKLTRVVLLSLLFTSYNGLQMGILNSYQHFKAPAMGSLFYNIGIIGVGVLFSPILGIQAFTIGVIVGAALSFFWQIPQLIKRGLFRFYKFNFNIFHPAVRKIFFLMIPVLLALSVNQINLVVNQNVASTLHAGTISALRLANRIMLLPFAVFGSAIAVAIFPTLTKFSASNNMRDFKETTSLGIRSTIFVLVPASIGLIALGFPIVRLMFEHGHVTHGMAVETAGILAYYALGITAQAGALVVIRSFYALKDTITPLTFGLVTIALNYFMNVTMVKIIGANGLALAYSSTGLFDFLTLTFLLRRKIGHIGLKQIVMTFIKVTVAALIMGVAAWFTAGIFETHMQMGHVVNQLIQVLVSIAVAVIVYAGISLALKMEEANMVIGILKRKFART